MSLPKIAISTFICTLPESKVDIKYRAFNVGEEKILMLAAATKEKKFTDIYLQIKNVVEACILSNIDIDTLSTLDFEYAFLKIKSAARGSIEDLVYKCKIKNDKGDDCNSDLVFKVDFDKLEISSKFPDGKIIIDKDFIIKLKLPTVADLIKIQDADLNELELLAVSLEYVQYCGETSSEFTLQEALEFLENLNTDQIKPIIDYFDAIPVLQYKHKIVCTRCGHEHNLTLSGIENFFG